MPEANEFKYFWVRNTFSGSRHLSGSWAGAVDEPNQFAGKMSCVNTESRHELEVDLNLWRVSRQGFVWVSPVAVKAKLPFLLTTDPTVQRLYQINGTFRAAEKWRKDLEKFKRLERMVGIPGGTALLSLKAKLFSEGYAGQLYSPCEFSKTPDSPPIAIMHDEKDQLGWFEPGGFFYWW